MADVDVPNAASLASADAAYERFPDFANWLSTVDSAEFQQRRDALANRRAASTQEHWERAVEIATRAAALETGAIEGLYAVDRGFTFSVASQAAAWELAMDERGEQIRPLFEAHLRAYELILDAATKSYPISEAYVRRLHEVLTSAQTTYRVLTTAGWQDQDLPKGVYKSQPNHPWRGGVLAHAYAPVAAVPPEMHRLVTQLQGDAFAGEHPVIQAAYSHYALVAVHPFADGNGRVARALSSIYLYRSDSLPLLVYSDQAADYIGALERADAGEHQAFTDFIYERAVGAIGRVSETLRLSSTPVPTAAIERLQALTYVAHGITYPEFQNAATTLNKLIASTIEQEAKGLNLPSTIATARSTAAVRDKPDVANFRVPVLGALPCYMFSFSSPAPANASVKQAYRVLVSVEGRAPSLLVQQLASEESLEVTYAEIHPEPTADLRYRLNVFVRAGMHERLAELTRLAEERMRARRLLK